MSKITVWMAGWLCGLGFINGLNLIEEPNGATAFAFIFCSLFGLLYTGAFIKERLEE